MAHRQTATPGEIIIMVAGAAMLVFSFFKFAGTSTAWGSFYFPIASLLPIYCSIMAAQVALTTYGGVNLRGRRIVGYTSEQLLLVLGLLAALMSLAWLVTDVPNKKIGL